MLVIPAWVFALYSRCKSAGVKINGTKTSDVICYEESKTNTHTTTDPTSKSVVSLISRVTSHRPHEGVQTQKTLTTTTTSATGHSITSGKVPSNKGNHFGKAFVAHCGHRLNRNIQPHVPSSSFFRCPHRVCDCRGGRAALLDLQALCSSAHTGAFRTAKYV